jgi:tRNA A37 threonylcarbamoyladenosine dehydratase
MMQDAFSRTRLLMGNKALQRLQQSRVAVFGVGGVGGYATEVLARSGVGELHLVDNDRVCTTNLNRQLLALTSNIGQLKVDVAASRIRDINPSCKVYTYPMFYLPDNADSFDLSRFDYVVDCIDTVSAKLELIRRCHRLGTPIISSMGAANKFDATAFKVSDITNTSIDPLAKVIRKKLRKEGIEHLKVVFSEEMPSTPLPDDTEPLCAFMERCPDRDTCKQTQRRSIPASNAFVPAAAGIVLGGEVVKDLIR